MNIKSLIPLFLLIISVQNCKLNPPNQPELENNLGYVYVTSNVTDAAIYVDGVNSGKFTPDSVETTIGEHEILITKENYSASPVKVNVVADSVVKVDIKMSAVTISKTVLLEDFSNVSCGPCVLSNIILENIFHQYDRTQVVKIKYPTSYPSPNDPFYMANKDACDQRMSDYGVLFTPTIWIDGVVKPIPTDSVEIKTAINERLNSKPQFKISAKDSLGVSSYHIFITLNTFDLTDLNMDNVYLYTVVTEKYISFAEPPGSNGETQFYDVMREMLPNPNGFQLIDLTSNSSKDFTYSVLLDSEWDVSQLNTVIFVQNKVSKEVYQSFSIN